MFNALAGEKISIVKDTPGVTRDRIYADVDWLDRDFTLIDTGGIEPDSSDIILSQMREQAQIAIDTADVIIFITDVKQGLVDSDSKVADMLRRSHKPVVLVVNKVDSFEKYMTDVYEFYNLGIGDPHPISAASMLGLGDMLDEVVKHFPDSSKQNDEDDRPRVAIVGKPNVGKSSLLNTLLDEDRAIVTDIAGTTRDVLEEMINVGGIPLNIIDTAGIRDTDNVIEQIGVEKSKTLAMEADLVLLMFDGSRELTDEDRELIKLTENKKSIVLVNKLDLEQKIDTDELEKLTGGFINISVKADKGVEKLYDAIKSMFIKGDINVDNQVLISGERNKASLVKAKNSLENVIETIANGMPEDFMIMDLTDAYEALGEISGETLEEDIIDRIFSEFCLGK